MSFDAPLVAVGELDRIEAVVVVAASGVEVEVADLAVWVLVELSTLSVFVELPFVLEELTSLPPSPH